MTFNLYDGVSIFPMHCFLISQFFYIQVVLLNATSTPLELRFDIPFGVAPRVLGLL